MKVLFVCLGNICRSPAGEGIFQKMVDDAGLSQQIIVDSAGTSAYHTNEEADGRMQLHAEERGYKLTSLARQLVEEDFKNFDYILTMDPSNYQNALHLAQDEDQKQKVKPMVSYCKIHNVEEVPDPYYGGDEGFRLVLDILEDSCAELLTEIKGKL